MCNNNFFCSCITFSSIYPFVVDCNIYFFLSFFFFLTTEDIWKVWLTIWWRLMWWWCVLCTWPPASQLTCTTWLPHLPTDLTLYGVGGASRPFFPGASYCLFSSLFLTFSVYNLRFVFILYSSRLFYYLPVSVLSSRLSVYYLPVW